MATSTESSNGVAKHNQSTPEDPNNLAGDRLRVREAIQVQNLVKGRKYLDALTDAETKAAYGDLYKAPDGDDMIAVDSNFKTENHYHAPAGPQPKPLPAWAKVALTVAALAGAGGAGAWAINALKPTEGAVTAHPDKDYRLEFWEPEPAK